MSSSHFTRVTGVLILLGALALSRDARAQAGDLDILSRTVPPVVMLQFDTSGSMRNIVLPSQYITARGTGSPSVWFNKSNNVTTHPASFLAASSAYYCGSSGCTTTWATTTNTGSVEDYRPTCQIFSNTTTTTGNNSLCRPHSTAGTGCQDDNQDSSSPQGGSVTIRCWQMPGGCTNVPAGITCTTAPRTRRLTSTTNTSQQYTVITMPDVSYTATTDYPQNYLWWLVQQIYKGGSALPVPYINQDRLAAAKQAVTDVVNTINVDGNPPKVKFGLARYSENTGDDNGGFTVVPADLNNKATLLATVATLPASGNTPLSETLVDVARYLAGSDRLGAYPVYNRDTAGNFVSSGYPTTPVTSSCEKVFVIVVTDGLPTADNNDHYSGTGNFNTTFTGFIDGDGSYLDDVAKKLYATDIRPTLSGNQNVITYTVGFTLASPLLQDAATQGHGTYFQSNNATDLADSLTGAIFDIIARNTTLTSATVPATRSAFGNGFYTAYFLPSGTKTVWPGHLQAYTLDSNLVVRDAGNAAAIDPVTKLFYEPRNPHWDVSARLIAQYATRNVYTTKGGARVNFTAANFFDPNDPNGASITTKLVPTDLGITATDKNNYPQLATHVSITDPSNPGWLERLGDSIIDFTRGVDSFDDDTDGNRTEVRPFVFGDVFHSSPVAVGPPLPFLRFETGYGPATDSTSFMGRFGRRQRVLFVGANDGMLHGFDSGSFTDPNGPGGGDEYYTPGTGNELFGYIPGFVLNKVKDLPRDSIGAKRYFVDGAPIAADAWLDYNNDGTKGGDEWTTVMLAPMREGGEGVLALDITDPNASSGNHNPYPRLMWEFTNAGLGQTWSRPIITRVKMLGTASTGDRCGANDGDGDCKEQWVAIFGAGYVDQANPNMGVYISDPNNATFQKSRGVFIVDLKTGVILSQLKPAAGTAPSTDPFKKMNYAVAAEPTVLDMNSDGFADLVYIGDLGGQLWKWDISRVGVPTSGVVPTSIWPAQVYFEAPVVTVAAGRSHYMSIFQGAAAALSKGVLTLSFASGERADLGYMGDPNPGDPNNPMGLYDDNNRFWVVKDRTPTGTGAFPTTIPIHETLVTGKDKLTDITSTLFDNDPNDAGYFFKVPEGQKFMTDHLIFGGVVITLAYLPDLTGTGASGSCALGGTTFEYAWKLDNGTGVLTANGAPPSTSNPAIRTKSLGNGAPTNPRITISKSSGGFDSNGNAVAAGTMLTQGTVQTSSGEVAHPEGLPPGFDPVEQVFWRQDF